MRKSGIRKTKADKIDAFLIARMLMNTPDLRFFTHYDLDRVKLKNLSRFQRKLVKQCTQNKIQLTSYLNQVFPELQYFFSEIHKKSVYAFLSETSAPELIASTHMTHLAHLPNSVPTAVSRRTTHSS